MTRAYMFAPAGTLLAGLLLVSGVREQYQMQPAQPMKAIPAVLLGEKGVDMIVPDEERKIAGMSDYVMRAFGGDTLNYDFSLYVGYYDRQVQGKTIHSPKNCLPGAGWQVMDAQRIPAPGTSVDGTAGTVNRVLLANEGVRALVYYWYQGRGRIESNEYKVKWDLLLDAALYGRTEEALVRIVVPIEKTEKGAMARVDDAAVLAADAVAKKVAAQVTPMVSRVLPAFPRT